MWTNDSLEGPVGLNEILSWISPGVRSHEGQVYFCIERMLLPFVLCHSSHCSYLCTCALFKLGLLEKRCWKNFTMAEACLITIDFWVQNSKKLIQNFKISGCLKDTQPIVLSCVPPPSPVDKSVDRQLTPILSHPPISNGNDPKHITKNPFLMFFTFWKCSNAEIKVHHIDRTRRLDIRICYSGKLLPHTNK